MAETNIKVLSLLQPWATLAILGIKTIETRSWQTSYRGRLLIHASKGKAGKLIAERAEIRKCIPPFKDLLFGFIIGEVELVDILPASKDWEDEFSIQSLEFQAFGDESKRYCWRFNNAVAYDEPIPATGRMGLWEI